MFDANRDVRFRGKPIAALTEPELRTALIQSLERVHYLEAARPVGVWPSFVPHDGPREPMPMPRRNDFDLA